MRKGLMMMLVAACSAAACVSEEELLVNKLFYSTDYLRNEVRVATDEGVSEMTREVSVAIASPMEADLTVSFTEAPELMDTYRNAYYAPEAQLLPSEYCNLDDLKTIIYAGTVTSVPVSIGFTGLNSLDLSDSKEYVLPVTLSADGIELMESRKTMYFVIRQAYLVNMAGDLSSNRAWPIWDDFEQVKHLETFTMEALIYNYGFDNGMVKDGDNTWDSSTINTIMGVEDHFLVRIGDSTIPENQLQVACAYKDNIGNTTYRKAVTSAAMQLKKDRWYHIAVTFDRGMVDVYIDGHLKGSGDMRAIGYGTDADGNQYPVEFTAVDFGAPHSEEDDGKPRCFWVGYSYQPARYLDGMMAEARLWNRVLSAEEINAPGHFYKLYPENIDDSLLAYWKFNDGEGKVVRDHSIYGNDLTAGHDLLWYPVELK